MDDVAEDNLISRQLHAVPYVSRVTRSIDVALSSTPPVVCTATSHTNIEVSLVSHEALPAYHTRLYLIIIPSHIFSSSFLLSIRNLCILHLSLPGCVSELWPNRRVLWVRRGSSATSLSVTWPPSCWTSTLVWLQLAPAGLLSQMLSRAHWCRQWEKYDRPSSWVYQGAIRI